MASPRPPSTQMQSLFVEFGLPAEPKLIDKALDSKCCQIHLTQCWDLWQSVKSTVHPLDEEFEQLPYKNSDGPDLAMDEECRATIIVYITDLFDDGRDFAYYIPSQEDISTFNSGMNGMQAYGGPLVATPIFIGDHVKLRKSHKLVGKQSSMDVARWKYLYETARVAWSRLVIDPEKVAQIKSRNAHSLRLARAAAAQESSAD
ncbi:hypothetical protein HBI80_057420 [Parastagonospora nodorum]|nr:hypothetical protein HBI80_057420 [Parastagonospora nodorum]